MNKGKICIGTSGWVYPHWENIFYPEGLLSKDKLKYFSQHFKTTEVNYSFYRLPRPTTYQNWYSQTPGDFLFAVKASRFITHIKRLKDVKEPWKIFIKNALNLKEKLGPVLFQFPSSFKATEENIKRLEDFLEENCSPQADGEQFSVKLRFAFEFRHKTWCEEKIYKLLKKHRVAWVITDSPSFPKAEKVTADFVYLRMHAHTPQRGQGAEGAKIDGVSPRLVCGHGSKVLFSSKYTKKELNDLTEKIKKWSRRSGTPLRRGKDVFVYFNNDAHGYAIQNAKELSSLINS